MPISASELILFGSANRPEDDASTSGGAQDSTDRPEFVQFTAAAVVELVSDGADSRNVDIQGRNASGAVISETVGLNGTTPVLSSNTYERIHFIRAQSTDGSRTITVSQGSGGATRGTIPPNENGFYAMFLRSASGSSPITRFEKIFWENTNGSLTLNSAVVRLTADPESRIRIGCEASVDGTQSVSNRLTTPGSVTFVDDDTDQGVPGGELGPGEAIGVWVEQALTASDTAKNSSFTTQLAGTTI